MSLSAHHPGHLVYEAHVLAHLEALVESVDVAQVASWNDDPVRHLPVKLLAGLDASCLLPLQLQTATQTATQKGTVRLRSTIKVYIYTGWCRDDDPSGHRLVCLLANLNSSCRLTC